MRRYRLAWDGSIPTTRSLMRAPRLQGKLPQVEPPQPMRRRIALLKGWDSLLLRLVPAGESCTKQPGEIRPERLRIEAQMSGEVAHAA